MSSPRYVRRRPRAGLASGNNPTRFVVEQSGVDQYAKQASEQCLRCLGAFILERNAEALCCCANGHQATRHIHRDVGDEIVTGIVQGIIAMCEPVDAGIGPALPRNGRTAAYPAAFERVEQGAGRTQNFLAAVTAVYRYRDRVFRFCN